MIEFQPVRLEDRATIERFTMSSDITNCDLSFSNMYCWQEVYRTREACNTHTGMPQGGHCPAN